jgi:hypothetical protein
VSTPQPPTWVRCVALTTEGFLKGETEEELLLTFEDGQTDTVGFEVKNWCVRLDRAGLGLCSLICFFPVSLLFWSRVRVCLCLRLCLRLCVCLQCAAETSQVGDPLDQQRPHPRAVPLPTRRVPELQRDAPVPRRDCPPSAQTRVARCTARSAGPARPGRIVVPKLAQVGVCPTSWSGADQRAAHIRDELDADLDWSPPW